MVPDPIWVELSLAEMLHAGSVGTIRQFNAVRDGRKSRLDDEKDNALAAHINGAIGEIAVAKVLNRYFDATVDTFKAADLGKNIQVRLRTNHTWDLIVRKDDDPEDYFILVTGTAPKLAVRGYIQAKYAMKQEYIRDYGNRNQPAYFVPQNALTPLKKKDRAA